MKFAVPSFLILLAVCSAAEPPTTGGGHFKVIASSSKKAPQMLVVKGTIKSLTGSDHLDISDAQVDKSGIGERRSLDGPGFEVEEGHLTGFNANIKGRGGGDGDGICAGQMCFKNVIATVSGSKYGYGGQYYGKEYIKLCLVDSGGDSCWTVTCPSAKQVPDVVSDPSDCTPADHDDCGCTVHDDRIAPNTVKITIDTFSTCERRLEDGGTDRSLCGRRLKDSRGEAGIEDTERSMSTSCNYEGSVAEVVIVCADPRYA